MKWKIFSLFIFVAANLLANPLFEFEGDLFPEEGPLIVSLGSGCDTALTLRDCELRTAAFPFDWLVCGNHNRFIAVLNEDFQFFTEEKCFVQLNGSQFPPNSLMNSYYDIMFYHEGSVLYDWDDLDKYKEQLDRMKIKYTRRIDRFRQLRHYPGKVFFIRNFTTSTADQAARHGELAEELRNALSNYFPDLDFTLVIVTYTDVNAPDIKGVNGVFEFKMERPPWRQEYVNMYKVLLNTR